MKKEGHKMLIADHGNAAQSKVKAAQAISEARKADEAARLAAIRDAGAIPEECGPDILASPARGGFVLHRNIELLPVGSDKVEAVHRGYGGRSAIRRADAFDGMLLAAIRTKRPCPLQGDQIAMGRRYADLVAVLSSDGTKLSQLQSSFGGGDGSSWIDRRITLSQELAALRHRIGVQPALQVRSIRPSERNPQRTAAGLPPLPHIFTARDIVDMVCIEGRSIKQVLKHFEWRDNGRNCKAAIEALSDALDRMLGVRALKSS